MHRFKNDCEIGWSGEIYHLPRSWVAKSRLKPFLGLTTRSGILWFFLVLPTPGLSSVKSDSPVLGGWTPRVVASRF